MKGLLIKDIRLMAKQKTFFVSLVCVVCILLTTSQQMTFLAGFATFMGGWLSITTISYDEFDNGYSFLFTLPIDRKDYVREKYVFGLLAEGLGCLVSLLVILVHGAVAGKAYCVKDVLPVAVGAFIGCFLFLSFSIPAYLKFGAEKGRYVMIGMYVVFFALFSQAPRAMEKLAPLVERAGAFLEEGNSILLIGLAAAVCFVVVTASYIISVRFMQGKEF